MLKHSTSQGKGAISNDDESFTYGRPPHREFPRPEKNGENARYLDICKCLDALVEGAREQKPGIAVIAGDIFHQARVWSDRGLKEQQTAVKFLRELSDVLPGG